MPRHQASRLLLLHGLQARLERVVSLSLRLQICFDLTDL
jgi:hypothetical protein